MIKPIFKAAPKKKTKKLIEERDKINQKIESFDQDAAQDFYQSFLKDLSQDEKGI